MKDKEQVQKLKIELYQNKIQWVALKYHKRPPVLSTLYDILKGIIFSWYHIRKKRIEIVHARSYVPAFIALILKKLLGIKFIFDMRGFWPDERSEGNLWKKDSLVYRLAKFFEKKFLLDADEIVVLTEQAKNIIKTLPYLERKDLPIVTIPTCVDLDRFKIFPFREKNLMKLRDRFVLIYLGSIGTWYMLKEMVDFFLVLRSKIKRVFFLFLTPGEKSFIETELSRATIPKDCYLIREVAYEEVPKWLSYADVSISFIRPTFSKRGSCPTKFGESLACGLPMIINSGIGDCDEFVAKEKVGVLVKEFSLNGYHEAIDELERLLETKDFKDRCRQIAKKSFSLNEGIEKYHRIYQNILTDEKNEKTFA